MDKFWIFIQLVPFCTNVYPARFLEFQIYESLSQTFFQKFRSSITFHIFSIMKSKNSLVHTG